MTTATAPESQPFQAEDAELLNLMVHSVYSENDIFLRELISNASDACDKLRYEAISAPELITNGAPPDIRIVPDPRFSRPAPLWPWGRVSRAAGAKAPLTWRPRSRSALPP